MSARRRSSRLMAASRRSQRLEKGNFQLFLTQDVTTPRTLFRKVLQTQPMASPLVPEKADSPKPVETVFQFPSRNDTDSNLEISLSDPIPKEALRPALLRLGKKKKVRLSEFERGLAKQLPSTTAKSFSDNTSLTGSLQVSLGTPVSPPPDGKRGLIRRPKSYKGVKVMTFEGGLEQNLQQIKGSHSHYVDLPASGLSGLSNTTETIYADTELFAQSQLSTQNRAGLPVLPSQPASARKSSPHEIMLSSAADLQIPQQGVGSDTDTGTAWQDQKDILMPGTKCADSTEGVPEGKAESPREVAHAREQAVKGRMTSTPTTRDAAGMDAVPQQQLPSPEREQQESLQGNHLAEQEESLHARGLVEQHLSPKEPLSSGICTPKPFSLVDADLSVAPTGNRHVFLHEKPTKRSVKTIVAHIIKELDRHMAPHVVDQDVSETDLVEECSSSKGATRISQSGTPARRVSRQAGEDRTIQQSGNRRKPKVSDLEHEAAVVSKIDSEDNATRISQRGTPAKRVSRQAGEDRTIQQSGNRRKPKVSDLEHEAAVVSKIDSEDNATRISQRGTPARSVSRRDAEQLEKEAGEDGAIQQAGNRSKPREMSDSEHEAAEAAVVSEMEMEHDVDDISEVEMDSEDNEPPVKTPAFVRLKAFQCSPLLSSPHTLKVAASKSASEQPLRKQVTKESKKARREKREPRLPSSWVKKLFSHYARMPVAKDAFQAVEKCVNLYFKHLSDDLEAYTNHARRKTVESADLELLMRRQGLITDKMPLNVLIERYLPLEYRKLLIPVATSGNKVIPLNLR